MGGQEASLLILGPQHLPPRLVESVSSSSGSSKHRNALTDVKCEKSIHNKEEHILEKGTSLLLPDRAAVRRHHGLRAAFAVVAQAARVGISLPPLPRCGASGNY